MMSSVTRHVPTIVTAPSLWEPCQVAAVPVTELSSRVALGPTHSRFLAHWVMRSGHQWGGIRLRRAGTANMCQSVMCCISLYLLPGSLVLRNKQSEPSQRQRFIFHVSRLAKATRLSEDVPLAIAMMLRKDIMGHPEVFWLGTRC